MKPVVMYTGWETVSLWRHRWHCLEVPEQTPNQFPSPAVHKYINGQKIALVPAVNRELIWVFFLFFFRLFSVWCCWSWSLNRHLKFVKTYNLLKSGGGKYRCGILIQDKSCLVQTQTKQNTKTGWQTSISPAGICLAAATKNKGSIKWWDRDWKTDTGCVWS